MESLLHTKSIQRFLEVNLHIKKAVKILGRTYGRIRASQKKVFFLQIQRVKTHINFKKLILRISQTSDNNLLSFGKIKSELS